MKSRTLTEFKIAAGRRHPRDCFNVGGCVRAEQTEVHASVDNIGVHFDILFIGIWVRYEDFFLRQLQDSRNVAIELIFPPLIVNAPWPFTDVEFELQ